MTPELSNDLTDISAHVEHVAINNPAGSDLNILAHAIHNLSKVIERLADG